MTRTVLIVAAAVMVTLFASGCGQRGPLYLRDSPPPGMKPPIAKPYEPVLQLLAGHTEQVNELRPG